MAKKTDPPVSPRHNPVAKFAVRFNRATTHRDRNTYRRKPKHKGREPFPMGNRPWETAPGLAA